MERDTDISTTSFMANSLQEPCVIPDGTSLAENSPFASNDLKSAPVEKPKICSKPLAVDLFCGLGGWAEGFLAEGYDVIGFDIERHDYGTGGYPGQLVLQDVLTLHGSQFKDAAVIVASPPCQKYSYMAMPWMRAKQMAAEYRSGVRSIDELNALFNACFRIAGEAGVPLIVENVRGAQEWVGPAAWNFGSFYLWGDIPALMPFAFLRAKRPGHDWNRYKESGEVSAHWRVDGADWLKGSPGQKTRAHANIRDGHTRARHLTNQHESELARLVSTAPDGIKVAKSGRAWYAEGLGRVSSSSSSSSSRKLASAQIAKIPFPLARWIAQVFKPVSCEAVS